MILGGLAGARAAFALAFRPKGANFEASSSLYKCHKTVKLKGAGARLPVATG